MSKTFISKENISANISRYGEILISSLGYDDFHKKILENGLEHNGSKTCDIASSGFIDFNNHLYEDINHMNSISSGIYLEMSLVTFRIFIWSSKGEGFEIFKHVLRGEEISNLKSVEDIKEYMYKYINELEQGITKTYSKNINQCFEEFGLGIESKKIPLPGILQFLTTENNINDFR
ncbi:MAG: hypothetical protein RRZ84_03870 [Romboutsia sp.]